jgi:hypothetical protein
MLNQQLFPPYHSSSSSSSSFTGIVLCRRNRGRRRLESWSPESMEETHFDLPRAQMKKKKHDCVFLFPLSLLRSLFRFLLKKKNLFRFYFPFL